MGGGKRFMIRLPAWVERKVPKFSPLGLDSAPYAAQPKLKLQVPNPGSSFFHFLPHSLNPQPLTGFQRIPFGKTYDILIIVLVYFTLFSISSSTFESPNGVSSPWSFETQAANTPHVEFLSLHLRCQHPSSLEVTTPSSVLSGARARLKCFVPFVWGWEHGKVPLN